MNSVTRRKFFKWGISAAGAAVGAQAVADVCKQVTGEQALGPFFPRPGTPENPVKEDPNPQTPIYLANDNDLTRIQGRTGQAEGQVVLINGKLTDSNCQPIKGATLIIWQASHHGRYNHVSDADNENFRHPVTGEIIERKLDEAFQYWGKAVSDASGNYSFKTIVPGFYPADLQNAWYRPPHIHFMVSATGYPQLVTQMYFRGEVIDNNQFIQELNNKDYILRSKNLTQEQQEGLIVDFKRDPLQHHLLTGEFNITLER